MKILVYDIETSLQPVAVFSLQHNDYIHPDNILAERHLVSVCWRWLGEKKMHSVSLLDDPKRFAKDPHDDKHVVTVFHKVLNEADCLIHHNGDSFDLRYLKTRMLVHGLSALPPITTIDTYKVAKQQLMLNSNSLNYLGTLLKIGKKMDTPKGLWLDVLQGNRKAIKIMTEYNKKDVILLENVFKKLVPYIQNHISRELFGETGCPRCGSKSYQSRGTHKAITKIYQRYQCNKCGGWFRELKANKGSTRFRIL